MKPVPAPIPPTSDSEAADMLRDVMPDSYFVNTPATHMKRHLELLLRLQDGDITLDFHRHPGALLTELTLCAFDAVQPGFLARVCGTLSALGIDVRTASIYTLRDLHKLKAWRHDMTPTSRHRVALDTLILSEPYHGRERALTKKTIDRARTELLRVVRGETTVAQLMSKARRPLSQEVVIHDLALQNRDMGASLGFCTVISMRSADVSGLLFRTAGALTKLGIHIQAAQINNHNGIAEDVFFVTDENGCALPDKEVDAIAVRLKSLLQNGANAI